MLYFHDIQHLAMVMINPIMVPDVPSFEKDMDSQGWIKLPEERFRILQENIEGGVNSLDNTILIQMRRTELTKLTQKNTSGYIGFKNNSLIKIDDDNPFESFKSGMKYPIGPIKDAKPALMKIKGEVDVVGRKNRPMSISHYYNTDTSAETLVFLMYIAPHITFE